MTSERAKLSQVLQQSCSAEDASDAMERHKSSYSHVYVVNIRPCRRAGCIGQKRHLPTQMVAHGH